MESVDAMPKIEMDVPENQDEQICWLKANAGNLDVSYTWMRKWDDLVQSEIDQLKPLFGGDADKLLDKWANCKVTNQKWLADPMNKGVMALSAHAALAGDYVFATYVLSASGFPFDGFDEITLNTLIDAASEPGGDTLKRWMKFTFSDFDYPYPRINEFLGNEPDDDESDDDSSDDKHEETSCLKANAGNHAVASTCLKESDYLVQSEIDQFQPLFGGDADELLNKWANCKVTNQKRVSDPMIKGVIAVAANAALAGDYFFADYVLRFIVFSVECFDEITLNTLIDAASEPGGETLKRWMKFTFAGCDYAYPRINEFLGNEPDDEESDDEESDD